MPEDRRTHACPQCCNAVPGGGAARCRACTNVAAIERDAALVKAEIESGWVADLWTSFVGELTSVGSESPALRRRVGHAAEFFRELSRLFPEEGAVGAKSMAAAFDSRFLRRHLLASRFALARIDVPDFKEACGEATERRRAADILLRSRGKPYAMVLDSFAGQLFREQVAPKTIRLYLRAAEAFCVHGRVASDCPWHEDALVGYLKSSPGQAASLGRFIRYCRLSLGWEVRLPEKKAWTAAHTRVARDVSGLRDVLKELRRVPTSSAPTKKLARLFSLAFGVPAAQLIRERDAGRIRVAESGTIEITDDAKLHPHDALYEFAARWVELARRRSSKRQI
jgi:hypothetical protein